ncbi:MAG TPA: sulfatase, partial [Actinomycetota bacterium]|nr:sulfatase [Actinomycetota bacterium]
AVCWVGVVAVGVYVAEPASSQDDRPNVLVIVTDDERERDQMLVMPETLRIFGEGGTEFTHAFATTPQCCPSRASIFTGRYAHNHGVFRNQDGPKINQMATIQRYLHERAGYKTALVGRFLNAWDTAEDPKFFDKWALFRSGYYDKEFNVNGEVTRIPDYATDFIGEKSIEFLEEFEAEDDAAPWLMYVTVTAPHFPFYASHRYADAEVPEWPPTPALVEDNLGDKAGFVQKIGFTAEQGHEIYDKQLRTLMSADDMVGALFDKLDELGEDEETLAFFMSDNGFLLGEHGLHAKRLPYTESIHVPFYVRWPGRVEAGATDDRLVANIDIAPTVLDVAGLPPDLQIEQDGRSLFGPLERTRILTEQWGSWSVGRPTWASIRTHDYQYIQYYFRDSGRVRFREFYDLESDPWQTRNLLGDGDPGNNPDAFVIKQLEMQLERDRACAGLTCP